MSYNISALEGRNSGKDWPLIVQAVPCPHQDRNTGEACGAKEGEPCRSIGSGNPFFNKGGARADWHAERKYFAAKVWYDGREEGIPDDKIAPLIAGQMKSPGVAERLNADTANSDGEVGADDQNTTAMRDEGSNPSISGTKEIASAQSVAQSAEADNSTKKSASRRKASAS